jgi:hypothetical protein
MLACSTSLSRFFVEKKKKKREIDTIRMQFVCFLGTYFFLFSALYHLRWRENLLSGGTREQKKKKTPKSLIL